MSDHHGHSCSIILFRTRATTVGYRKIRDSLPNRLSLDWNDIHEEQQKGVY